MELSIENVSKFYGHHCALKEVSLMLTPGIYGLLGPNGAGKSTMMNLLTTILRPSKGKILYNGKNIEKLEKEYRKQIGYLPQKFGVYDEFTGLEMLYYFAALKGLKKSKELRKQIEEYLVSLELFHDAGRKIGHYSGGMRQRIGICQVLLGNPSILIFDEPTAGLDPKQRVYFKELLRRQSKDKIILLATHIVSDIEDTATEVLYLKKGDLFGREKTHEHLEEQYMEYFTDIV